MSKPTFIISRDEAEELMNSYITDCINESHVPNTIGGTINAQYIHQMRVNWWSRQMTQLNSFLLKDSIVVYKGLVAYSCWKKRSSSPNESDFFLAFEINNSIKLETEYDNIPQEEVLVRPFELIFYQTSQNAKKILEKKSLKFSEPETIERGFSPNTEDKVWKMKNDFKTDGPTDVNGKLYNETEFALFENRETDPKEVDLFLGQEGLKYVRYYFGFDKEKEVNRIRVILVGVDKDGKNILPKLGKTVDEIRNEEGPYILQTSWPPKRT